MNISKFMPRPTQRAVGTKDSSEKSTTEVVAETALYTAMCVTGTIVSIVTDAPIAFLAALAAVYYLRD